MRWKKFDFLKKEDFNRVIISMRVVKSRANLRAWGVNYWSCFNLIIYWSIFFVCSIEPAWECGCEMKTCRWLNWRNVAFSYHNFGGLYDTILNYERFLYSCDFESTVYTAIYERFGSLQIYLIVWHISLCWEWELDFPIFWVMYLHTLMEISRFDSWKFFHSRGIKIESSAVVIFAWNWPSLNFCRNSLFRAKSRNILQLFNYCSLWIKNTITRYASFFFNNNAILFNNLIAHSILPLMFGTMMIQCFSIQYWMNILQ